MRAVAGVLLGSTIIALLFVPLLQSLLNQVPVVLWFMYILNKLLPGTESFIL